jgi:NAD-specific glutamate dehydrogenase
MALISKKKLPFPISQSLYSYLRKHNRISPIPIHYTDLLRFDNAIPLYDQKGEDTLWNTVFYPQEDMKSIHESLKHIYAIMKSGGDRSVMEHLYIDRVDLCSYGNTQPFRVRIVNRINDNFDYFYIKKADASRIYGLELEDSLSPNRVSYCVHGQTLIEEHIAGIPGDSFMKYYLNDGKQNKIRLAKEFVKFNERCLVRLLGDMHSSNFVVDLTPDFDETNYRIRAIDFDQQSFEGRKAIYLPQYYKQNNPLIQLCIEVLTHESVKQYQTEERALIANRVKASREKMKVLINSMKADQISTEQNVSQLKEELSQHYQKDDFLTCANMGEILEKSLTLLLMHKKG